MTKSRKTLIKASSLQRVLIVAAIIGVTMTISIAPSNSSNNNAIAQPNYFNQPIEVHLDTSRYVLGDIGVIIKNLDTGDSVVDTYTDSRESPRYISYNNDIPSHDGDSLMACVKDMSTNRIACDKQTAFYDDDTTEFDIDMNEAVQVSTSD
jgi:hypothetical protein